MPETRPPTERSVNGSAPTPQLWPLHSMFGLWEADAEARHQAKLTGKPLGPVTCIRFLDLALGGALMPGLHILHGVPGSGKTALALQIASSCCCPSLYITAEMQPLELLRRITARLTGTFLGKFKSGELAPDHSLKLARSAVAEVPSLAFLDATQAPVSRDLISKMALTVKEMDRGNPHLLIVVDSLHSWAEGIAGGLPEYEALNNGLSHLRQIAAAHNCAVLAVSERNRSSMDKGGQSAGAGTRKIEYGAETIIDLGVEKDAAEDAMGEKTVTMKIEKNRNGATARAQSLKFHGALQRFKEATL